MLVVNFYGAPGAGKSTASSGLYHEMKKHWIEAEYIQEYAKELVWSGSSHMLSQQNYIFAKQEHRLNRLLSKVQVAISDSPLLLSSFYAPKTYPQSFHRLVFDFFHNYPNVNIFVKRSHEYSARGRVQNVSEADFISDEMQKFLRNNKIPFYIITANDASPKRILSWLLSSGKIEKPEHIPFSEETLPPNWLLDETPHEMWDQNSVVIPANLEGIKTVG